MLGINYFNMIHIPAYFDTLIEHFDPQSSSRYVHLGHWSATDCNEHGQPDDDFAAAQERLNHTLLTLAPLRDGMCLLDVGCGFGGTIAKINQSYLSSVLTGLNIDARQLAICRSISPNNGNQLIWHQGDALNLPFKNSELDIVLCVEAMFHFRSRSDFLREVYRVLKPGGVFVASDILISPSLQQLNCPGYMIEAAIQDGFGPWPDFWHSEGPLQALVKTSGFSSREWIDATGFTLPSHRYTTPSQPDWQNDSGMPGVRSALALRWLHENDFLQYVYFSLQKPD